MKAKRKKRSEKLDHTDKLAIEIMIIEHSILLLTNNINSTEQMHKLLADEKIKLETIKKNHPEYFI